jgi:hypothetical protein
MNKMAKVDLSKVAKEMMQKAESIPSSEVFTPKILLSFNEVSKLENDYLANYKGKIEVIPLNPDFPEVSSYVIRLGGCKYDA